LNVHPQALKKQQYVREGTNKWRQKPFAIIV